MRGLGTLINLAAVALGGGLGLFVGDRLPERMRVTIMQGLGLVTLAIGVTGLEPLYDADLGLRRFIILSPSPTTRASSRASWSPRRSSASDR